MLRRACYAKCLNYSPVLDTLLTFLLGTVLMELDRRSIIRITNSEAFQYAVQQRRNSINSIENLLPIA